MKRSLQLSAAQMAFISGAGGVIAASTFLFPVLLYAPFQGSGWLFRAQILLPPFLVGLPIWLLAAKNLKRGIFNERWKQEEIDSLRALSESRFVRALTWTLLLVFILALLLPQRSREIGWCFFILLQCLNTLRNAIRKPGDAARQPSWSSLSPIHSEHWGQH